MDKEQIKKALDDFEEDKFDSSKEILKKEVQDKLADHLEDKLGLQEEDDD